VENVSLAGWSEGCKTQHFLLWYENEKVPYINNYWALFHGGGIIGFCTGSLCSKVFISKHMKGMTLQGSAKTSVGSDETKKYINDSFPSTPYPILLTPPQFQFFLTLGAPVVSLNLPAWKMEGKHLQLRLLYRTFYTLDLAWEQTRG